MIYDCLHPLSLLPRGVDGLLLDINGLDPLPAISSSAATHFLVALLFSAALHSAKTRFIRASTIICAGSCGSWAWECHAGCSLSLTTCAIRCHRRFCYMGETPAPLAAPPLPPPQRRGRASKQTRRDDVAFLKFALNLLIPPVPFVACRAITWVPALPMAPALLIQIYLPLHTTASPSAASPKLAGGITKRFQIPQHTVMAS